MFLIVFLVLLAGNNRIFHLEKTSRTVVHCCGTLQYIAVNGNAKRLIKMLFLKQIVHSFFLCNVV